MRRMKVSQFSDAPALQLKKIVLLVLSALAVSACSGNSAKPAASASGTEDAQTQNKVERAGARKEKGSSESGAESAAHAMTECLGPVCVDTHSSGVTPTLVPSAQPVSEVQAIYNAICDGKDPKDHGLSESFLWDRLVKESWSGPIEIDGHCPVGTEARISKVLKDLGYANPALTLRRPEGLFFLALYMDAPEQTFLTFSLNASSFTVRDPWTNVDRNVVTPNINAIARFIKTPSLLAKVLRGTHPRYDQPQIKELFSGMLNGGASDDMLDQFLAIKPLQLVPYKDLNIWGINVCPAEFYAGALTSGREKYLDLIEAKYPHFFKWYPLGIQWDSPEFQERVVTAGNAWICATPPTGGRLSTYYFIKPTSYLISQAFKTRNDAAIQLLNKRLPGLADDYESVLGAFTVEMKAAQSDQRRQEVRTIMRSASLALSPKARSRLLWSMIQGLTLSADLVEIQVLEKNLFGKELSKTVSAWRSVSPDPDADLYSVKKPRFLDLGIVEFLLQNGVSASYSEIFELKGKHKIDSIDGDLSKDPIRVRINLATLALLQRNPVTVHPGTIYKDSVDATAREFRRTYLEISEQDEFPSGNEDELLLALLAKNGWDRNEGLGALLSFAHWTDNRHYWELVHADDEPESMRLRDMAWSVSVLSDARYRSIYNANLEDYYGQFGTRTTVTDTAKAMIQKAYEHDVKFLDRACAVYLAAGGNPDSKDLNGDSLIKKLTILPLFNDQLLIATGSNRTLPCLGLIQSSKGVNDPDHQGATAIMMANDEWRTTLIQAGADLSKRDAAGLSVMDYWASLYVLDLVSPDRPRGGAREFRGTPMSLESLKAFRSKAGDLSKIRLSKSRFGKSRELFQDNPRLIDWAKDSGKRNLVELIKKADRSKE